MRRLKQNRSWLFSLLVTVLFIWGQAGSIAHAVTYGSAPHKHDGKICVVSTLAGGDEDDLALPPIEISIPTPIYSYEYIRPTMASALPSQAVASTARSPPGQ